MRACADSTTWHPSVTGLAEHAAIVRAVPQHLLETVQCKARPHLSSAHPRKPDPWGEAGSYDSRLVVRAESAAAAEDGRVRQQEADAVVRARRRRSRHDLPMATRYASYGRFCVQQFLFLTLY